VTTPRVPRRNLVAVAIGGAIGALARVALATAFPTPAGQLPWATLAGNLVGAALLGAVLTWLTERVQVDPTVRLALGTGVLGAFTTYSTLAVEIDGLLTAGRGLLAGSYAVASLLLGLLGAVGGIRLARRASHRPRGDTDPAAAP
jgi:CrcB protein